MERPRLEVADVFRRHGPAWRAANEGHLSLAQRRAMSAVELCRTAPGQFGSAVRVPREPAIAFVGPGQNGGLFLDEAAVMVN